MEASEIRKAFIEFFRERQHKIVPSAPLVVRNDPTLMFTNAGMNQFKDYFLGTRIPEYVRAADTQKCLRVSGKHNDLEEVGIDTYHHTMFEMLGNWSFGDYFKQEAIPWAWELLTEVYKLPKEHLYVTVFEGDQEDGLDWDEESYHIWKKFLSEDHILKASKKDNFWEMGDTGPCGPSSEIHIDLRSPEEQAGIPAQELVNQDHPQVIEIWNLVFIEFNRMSSGRLENLPKRHVDTGMGFERLAMAIQKKRSNYDTDVFTPLIGELEHLCGKKYGSDDRTDVAFRVIVDHVRAVAFAIADGEMPSNNKAGYVIRRILRRAVRYGYSFLGFQEPFMYKLVPVLCEQFKEVFPELPEQQEFVERVMREEEAGFLRTLENGLKRIDELDLSKNKEIDGKTAFDLYDTYGFPLDLTSLIADERGVTVDHQGFEKELALQKERSKSDAIREAVDWVIVNPNELNSSFVGYDRLETQANILRYREVKEKKNSFYQLVLDQTPFYAESGGQVGDKGWFIRGDERVEVIDTQKENDLIIHLVRKLPSDPTATITARVNEEARRSTENNHSATHLLHAALRTVLGDHVQQRGSLVNEKGLRFDFSHYQKLTQEEIEQIEDIVNARIRENIPSRIDFDVPIDEARERGAMALFGEKYGETVRVVTFNPEYSIELCGGTHVEATGNIGSFLITSESSIASGIRRIEAVTGEGADHFVRDKRHVLDHVQELLNHPGDLEKSLKTLIDQNASFQKRIEEMERKEVAGLREALAENARNLGEVTVVIEQVSVPNAEALKNLSFELKNKISNLFMVLVAEINDKPMISMMVSDSLVGSHDVNAGKSIRELAKAIKGGGGGQPFYATAGGKDSSGIPEVLAEARKMAEEIFSVKI